MRFYKRLRLPRTVLILGAVSFMNDVASEMILPLLPIFLVSVLGAGPAVLGLIEGVADATASIMKLAVGMFADRKGHVGLLIRLGYIVSNLFRPLIGLVGSWPAVMGIRFTDRVGKGVRTSPRDALIAASVADERRGSAFGYHRAMDHAGASVGPVLAFILLVVGWSIRDVILVSIIPGLMAVVLVVFGLGQIAKPRPLAHKPFEWRALDPEYKRLLLASGGVSFAAIPDVLLIFWAFGTGMPVKLVPLLWAVSHVGRTLSSAALGTLSDRYGRKNMTLLGWAFRIGVLLILAIANPTGIWVWPLFISFTAVTASTEAVERAWISGLAPERLRASFFGAYHMITGLAVLPGAVLVGLVWEVGGSGPAFLFSAVLTTMFAFWLSRAAHSVEASGRTA